MLRVFSTLGGLAISSAIISVIYGGLNLKVRHSKDEMPARHLFGSTSFFD